MSNQQLEFDFDALINEAQLEKFAGIDVIEQNGRQYRVINQGSYLAYQPVGYKPSIMECGIHEYTPGGREQCAEECFGFICPSCGADSEGSFFVYPLNHDIYKRVGDCGARRLKIRHTWFHYRLLLQHEDSTAEPFVFTNCWVRAHKHKDSYKRGGWPITCVIATLIEDYERCTRMRVESSRLPPVDVEELRKNAR